MTLTPHESSMLRFLASCPRGLLVPELTWGHIESVAGTHWNEALHGLYAKRLIQAHEVRLEGDVKGVTTAIAATDLGLQVLSEEQRNQAAQDA